MHHPMSLLLFPEATPLPCDVVRPMESPKSHEVCSSRESAAPRQSVAVDNRLWIGIMWAVLIEGSPFALYLLYKLL
jgi:hypothetical protein